MRNEDYFNNALIESFEDPQPEFFDNLYRHVYDYEDFLMESDENDSDWDSDYLADDDLDNYLCESTGMFYSVQDSNVYRNLYYAKNPPLYDYFSTKKTVKGYESLLRLLEEIEILIKTWKKRLEHPFTAHLSTKEEELTFGEGCSESDLDTDIEEAILSQGHDFVPNENLTKIVFSRSIKALFTLFSNLTNFESFTSSLRRLRKRAYSLSYTLFLSALPLSTVTRLPDELWIKIWKYTQVPFVEKEIDSSTGISPLESDCVTDLFYGVGNIFCILLEILFQKESILRVPILFTLKFQNFEIYTKDFFSQVLHNYERGVKRLERIDEKGKEENERCTSETSDKKNEVKILNADYTVLIENIHSELISKALRPIHISSHSFNDSFVFIDVFSDEHYIRFLVWNSLTSFMTTIIHTEIKIGIYNFNRKTSSDIFSLIDNKIVFVPWLEHLEENYLMIHQWTFDKDASETQNISPDSSPIRISLVNKMKPISLIVKVELTQFNNNYFVVLNYLDRNEETSTLSVIDSLSRKIVYNKVFEEKLSLQGVKGSKIILRRQYSLLFLDIEKDKMIKQYSFESSLWVGAVFDSDPNIYQFAIFSSFCSELSLYEYDPKEYETPPKLLTSKSSTIWKFDLRYVQNYSLNDGVLYSEYIQYDRYVLENPFVSSEVIGIPINSLSNSHFVLFSTLLPSSAQQIIYNDRINRFSRNYKPRTTSLSKPFLINSSKLVVFTSSTEFLFIDFSLDVPSILEAENKVLKENKSLITDSKILDSLLNKSIRGEIVVWKKKYGFVKLLDYDIQRNIYIHISKFKSFVRKGKGKIILFQLVQSRRFGEYEGINAMIIN